MKWKFWLVLILTMWISMTLGGYITPMISAYLGAFAIIAPFIPASVIAVVFWLIWSRFTKKWAGGS